MAYCTACGEKVADNAKFCGHCGAEIGSNYCKSYDVELITAVQLSGPREGKTNILLYIPHMKKTITIAVPNSIQEGQIIRLKGAGKLSPEGKYGNLLIKMDVVTYSPKDEEKQEQHRQPENNYE